MKNVGRSVLRAMLGSFCGAYVFRAITLAFAPGFTWLGLIVGLVVGGAIGWVVPNLGQAIYAFRHSWRHTKVDFHPLILWQEYRVRREWVVQYRRRRRDERRMLRRERHEYRREICRATRRLRMVHLGYALCLMLSWLVPGWLLFYHFGQISEHRDFGWAQIILHGLPCLFGCVVFLFLGHLATIGILIEEVKDFNGKLRRRKDVSVFTNDIEDGIQDAKACLSAWNPASLLWSGLVWLAKKLCPILRQTVLMTHNNEGLVGLVGTAGGGLASSLLGWSALYGGLVGAMIGGSLGFASHLAMRYKWVRAEVECQ